jgi:hypothetical protein
LPAHVAFQNKNGSGGENREFLKRAFCKLTEACEMENQIKFSALREKFQCIPARPKGLRFFSELSREAQDFALSEEQNRSERFDWDDAEFLTEDFKTQLAEFGFEETEVYWSLGYCQGDGVAFYGRVYPESLKEKDRKAKRLIAALEAAGDALYLEEYLNERVKEISRELEKSGYAAIEYAHDENAIRDELGKREHLYEKNGTSVMTEFEFYDWKQADIFANQNNQEK